MCILLSITLFVCCWANIASSFRPTFASAFISATGNKIAQGAVEADWKDLGGVSHLIRLPYHISDNLASARVTSDVLEGTYVERKRLEGVLKDVFNEVSPENYLIIYGGKGVGKSTLVDYVAKDYQAVVKVAVRSVDDMASISAKFMHSLTNEMQAINVDAQILRKTLKEFKTTKKITPSIIFEVERSAATDVTRKSVLQDVRSMAKELSDVCNCIVVVSEAFAVIEFGRDKREVFVYVDELTYEESDLFLRKRGTTFTDREMKKIYDSLGGNPLVLKEIQLMLKQSSYSLDSIIDMIVNDALSDLKAFKLKPILKAIKENPKGVEPGIFESQTYRGIDISEVKFVGDAMKLRDAIVYRIDMFPKVFQMQSTRHKTALLKYEPIIDMKSWSFSRPVIDYHVFTSEKSVGRGAVDRFSHI